MVAMAIRRADVEDLREILMLERESDGAPHWSETIWVALLEDTASAAVQRVALVAVMAEAVTGFVVVSAVAGVAELESVAVKAPLRGQGIGKALCRSAMAWARELGATTMEMEVRASNEAARAVYRSLGFVEQGRRARYYRDPEEDAVLMMVSLQDG
jgi:ribosomal-protein-alanine N-acetyltransferase